MGAKRVHVSKSSDLDKDHPLETLVNDMALVLVDPKSGNNSGSRKRKERKA